MNLLSQAKKEEFKGKRVLLRVDFNVPLQHGKVVDSFRLKAAMDSIRALRRMGAKIILIAHLGKDGTESLDVVSKYMHKFIPLRFVPDVIGELAHKAVSEMKNGDVILLENIRRESGEMKNTATFAKALASLGDIYVNDGFSVSHREHTSIVGLPKLLPSYAGIQMEHEIAELTPALKNTKHPFLFILGGAKFSTKIPLVTKYLENADRVFIGGALANDFWKSEGFDMGRSTVEEGNYNFKKYLKNEKLILPVDTIIKNESRISTRLPNKLEKGDMIVDAGPETIKLLQSEIDKAKFIIWNGPLGIYQNGFDQATAKILKYIVKKKVETIIGGGDTVSIVQSLGIENRLKFVSTGGGATLDFLASGTLVGIQALK